MSLFALPAYVINLDEARWARMQGKLARWQIQAARFQAVDGRTLSTQLREQFPQGSRLSAGEKGCLLSHRAVWKHVTDAQLPMALIFEDDVTTELSAALLCKKVGNALAVLRGQFDILFLGKCCADCGRLKLLYDDLYQTFRTLCLHAYVITLEGAQKALSLTSYSRQIDEQIATALEQQQLTGYAFHPSLFSQDTVQNPSSLRSAGKSTASVVECTPPILLLPGKFMMAVLLGGGFLVLIIVLATIKLCV